MPTTVQHIEIAEYPLLKSGKVREVFDLGDTLLFVATDRISAFDCILPTPIPDKGRVLTQLSVFWFDYFGEPVPNHFLTADVGAYPSALSAYREELDGRSMMVKKAEVLPIECVVRGYLAGSGWAEYRESGAIAGQTLPSGLLESSELPEPIFTPATKAASGHDENISFAQMAGAVGDDLAARARDISVTLYSKARDYARRRGIIVADTKFEFGLVDGELTLVDEVLTPDSSRLWPEDSYTPGAAQPSFDKQYVRDYLLSTGWDREPPAPELPDNVVQRTREKYLQALAALVAGGHFE